MQDLTKTKEELIKLVIRASDIMTSADFSVYEKHGAVDIVTSSDLGVQNYLKEKLAALIPNSEFFCEENGLRNTTADYIWIIDPIDGTCNYSREIGECCISVALAYCGELVLGVVYAPYKEELFAAVKGEGATLNGKPISASAKTFEESLFCTALCLYSKDFAPQCMNILMEVYRQSNDFRRFGSCALELCYLAAGRCDLFFEIRVFPWDYAAATLILTEAGGTITSLDSEPLSLSQICPVIAANNSENHTKLLEIVTKHFPEIPYNRSLI